MQNAILLRMSLKRDANKKMWTFAKLASESTFTLAR